MDRPVDLTFLTNKSRLVLDTGRQRRPTFGSAAAAFGSESDINLLVEGRQQRPMAGLSKSVGSEEERFKAEIKTIKEQLDTKSQQLLTFEEKMEKYRKLENELNEKIQSLQSQLEKARSENVMVASTPVPSIESEKVAAGDDKLLQEQQKRIDSLLSEKIKLETDIAQLTQKINELSSGNNKLIQELNQYKSHVESLSSKLSAIGTLFSFSLSLSLLFPLSFSTSFAVFYSLFLSLSFSLLYSLQFLYQSPYFLIFFFSLFPDLQPSIAFLSLPPSPLSSPFYPPLSPSLVFALLLFPLIPFHHSAISFRSCPMTSIFLFCSKMHKHTLAPMFLFPFTFFQC